jgi:hypothetical protein
MVGSVRASLAVLLLLLAASAPCLSGQTVGEYSYEKGPDGTPRFTQTLRWTADPNVRSYEVTVQTASGTPVLAASVTEPTISLHLAPGTYRYRIVLCNLLGKPEMELPWKDITVLKAEVPRIANYEPRIWFLDDLKPEITLRGENLMPGATIELRREASEEAPVRGRELGRVGSRELRVAFPVTSITAGRYAIVVTDPGGLSHTVSNALTVRFQKPLSLVFSGGYGIPLAESAQYFTAAGGLEAGLTYHLPESVFELGGSLSYSFEQTQIPLSVSIAAARATVGAVFPLSSWLSALCYASGGYYFTMLNDLSVSASDPWVGGGGGLLVAVDPDLSLSMAAEYQCYFGLWQGLSLGIGTRIALDTPRGSVRQQPAAQPPGEPETTPKPLSEAQGPAAAGQSKSY